MGAEHKQTSLACLNKHNAPSVASQLVEVTQNWCASLVELPDELRREPYQIAAA